MQNSKPFNTRAFVALALALTCAGLPITGIVNHNLAFEAMSVSRHAWMAAHNILGFLFCVFALWHGILNFRTLRSHAAGLGRRLLLVSREAVVAGALVCALVALFVGHAYMLG